MMKNDKDKIFDDDDGRPIADMSGIDRPGIFSHVPRVSRARKQESHTPENMDTQAPERDEFQLTDEERKWYVLGALKATLLIGLAFAAGLGLITLILTLIWR